MINRILRRMADSRHFAFCVVFACIILKYFYFNYNTFGYLITLYKPEVPESLYVGLLHHFLPVLSFAFFVAAFVYIIRNHVWIIVFNIISDLWLISNHIYYKINDLFLIRQAIELAGNLKNGEVIGATVSYIPECLFYSLSTLIAALLLYWVYRGFRSRDKASLAWFALSLFMSLLMLCGHYFQNYRIAQRRHDFANEVRRLKGEEEVTDNSYIIRSFTPFSDVKSYAAGDYVFLDITHWPEEYIKSTSIYHHFLAIFAYEYFRPDDSEIVVDDAEIAPFLNDETKQHLTPDGPLIILMVESLESWTINPTGQLAEITRNLSAFSRNEHVLYCSKIRQQVLYGCSADGQLIVLTGLLPIQTGTTCVYYSEDVYPNYAGLFRKSVLVNPWKDIWNQDKMTARYGFKSLVQPETEDVRWYDEEIVSRLIKQLEDNRDSSICVLGITLTTHTPFDAPERENNVFDESVPHFLANYLNCLAATDKSIGRLLDYLLSDPLYSKSTIVITGDHTFFRNSYISNISQVVGINPANVGYVPLFIYSPKVKGNRQIDAECLQMDIYPTIMESIGCSDYRWKGFGVSLFNDAINRIITEPEAYTLSDKLIRSDYFGK